MACASDSHSSQILKKKKTLPAPNKEINTLHSIWDGILSGYELLIGQHHLGNAFLNTHKPSSSRRQQAQAPPPPYSSPVSAGVFVSGQP